VSYSMIPGKVPGEAGGKGDHRCTPPAIHIVARHAIGIKRWDLDPASNPHSTIPARMAWYGRGPLDDGLILPWFGHVWLNPPFSNMPPWVEKWIKEANTTPSVASATFLGPGDTTAKWWRRIARACDAWAAWPRRQHCPIPDHPKGSPPGPLHLFYIGPRATRWRAVMEHIGCYTKPGG
jgi:hypothetical protein